MATLGGLESTSDREYAYCVDSGIGCFMDADAAITTFDEETDPLLGEMSEHYTDTWGWANYCVDQASGANIIAFSSGWGDGGYPSYFGYDQNGNTVCLITDFCILGNES